MLEPNHIREIPELTAEVAKAAFPKGSVAMKIRDTLGPLFQDVEFGSLYPVIGQPAESPARLAVITLLQFMKNLTDQRGDQEKMGARQLTAAQARLLSSQDTNPRTAL